jgi:hypothetical protein
MIRPSVLMRLEYTSYSIVLMHTLWTVVVHKGVYSFAKLHQLSLCCCCHHVMEGMRLTEFLVETR